MDKLKSKELFRLYNVPTPSYYVARSGDLDRLEQIHSSFGFPSFVKPRSGGSSVGAGAAKNLAELKQRFEDAARFDEWILVERLIRGREVAVGLLDGNALGAIEIEPKGGFYGLQVEVPKRPKRISLPGAALTDPLPGRVESRGARGSRRRRDGSDPGRLAGDLG